MMKIPEQLQDILKDKKKLSIIVLPILTIALVLIFIVFPSKDNDENVFSDNKTQESLLLPESYEEDSIKDKYEAYERIKEERLAYSREQDQSALTQRDFFLRMQEEEDQKDKVVTNNDLYNLLDDLDDDDNYIPPTPQRNNRIPSPNPPKKFTNRWDIEEIEPEETYNYNQDDILPEKPKNNSLSQRIVSQGEKKRKEIKQNLSRTEDERMRKSVFFSVDDQTIDGNSTSAVVEGDYTISRGSKVKFRILEDMKADDNSIIPANTLVTGIAQFTEDRITFKIESVRIGKNFYPVTKKVYGLDGLEGIDAPESIKAELRKQAENDYIDGTDIDLGTTGSGLLDGVVRTTKRVSKSVLKSKNQTITVDINSNFKVYLR